MLINDLLSAIDTYPAGNVEIDVINFQEPGGHINAGEVCTFQVRVANDGVLDMKKLKLHVEGSRYTSVRQTPADSFSNAFISASKDVDAQQSAVYGPFQMRADTATPNGGTLNVDLLSVHISTYDAGLNHILRDRPHHAGNPEETYSRHIHPD